MDTFAVYAQILMERIQTIARTQREALDTAAAHIAQAIAQDRRVHVLGTGAHSMMAAEEVLWRAGGLAAWNPILDPGTSLLHGAKRSVSFERMPGYGVAVLNANGVGQSKGEIMVLINAYGIDPMSLDVALECRKRGVEVIAITSTAYGESVPRDSALRHPSGKNLYEVASLVIDSCVPLGDAVIPVEGIEQKVGSASTVLNSFIMNALQAAVVEKLIAEGVEPPVFMSANLPGGDEANRRWETRYGPQARYML